ncbi:MAG: adenylate/guanylate cyclase domain-containing protein [Ilumatobacteraceae bacterium]|nr:adenylate/guanylate cyclase domain-containing protein [Ilumatobacteraceae bacterium]
MGNRGDVAVPSGVVAFLFTDVEGSTGLWATDAEAMAASLRVHDDVVRTGIEQRGGYVFTTAGDAFCAAFQRASDAVGAAEQIQEALDAAPWPGPSLRVRMGVHLGEAEERAGDYFGPTVNTAARVEAAGHGGQVLITDSVRTAANVVGVTDLGEHPLMGVPERVRIYQVGNGAFPPLRTRGVGGSNLPIPATRLVGRDDDVRDLRLLLAQHRLVTLMAVGGTGKTRVAIEVGDQELAHWRDGVWFVDLTQASSDADVAVAVARSIGLALQGGDVAGQVAASVASQSMLIVLDNCEHLIDACAELVHTVMTAGGSSKVLATSREWLDIDGEHVFQLRSLDTSDANSAAVQLFVQRARAIDPTFAADADGVVAEVCRRLDGMPLAIELAASRVSVLTPNALLEGLDDRFRLLSGGRRRQRGRTLEATIDWSYDLLADDEQRFFRRLGVFIGSFDIAAAATVARTSVAEAIDLIESLYARSLITSSTEWPGRFQLLETLKAYAEDRLVDAGEADDARGRLHRHFAPASTPTLVAPTQSLSATVAMEPDHANITQAAEWLYGAELWSELADFLLHTSINNSRNDFRNLELLGRCRNFVDDPDVDAELAQCQIWNQMTAADWASYAETCLEEMGRDDPHYAGWANLMLSLITVVSHPDRGIALIDRFVELPSRLDDDTKRLWEMNYRATAAGFLGQTDPARRYAAETVAICRRLEVDPPAALMSTQILGVCSWSVGDRGGLTRSIDDADELVGSTNDPGLRLMTDFLTALASIGDTQIAGPLRQYLRRCATGQLALSESDALVILAAISEADGAIEHARSLITSPISPRAPGSWLAMHVLAQRLGIGNDVHQRRKAERSNETIREQNRDLPKQALHTELRRRDWLD